MKAARRPQTSGEAAGRMGGGELCIPFAVSPLVVTAPPRKLCLRANNMASYAGYEIPGSHIYECAFKNIKTKLSRFP